MIFIIILFVIVNISLFYYMFYSIKELNEIIKELECNISDLKLKNNTIEKILYCLHNKK